MRRSAVPTALALALAACDGEPGADDLQHARRLQAENRRDDAAAAFARIAHQLAGTPAAREAEAALHDLRCEDARVRATDAWRAVQAQASDDAGMPEVAPSDVQARRDAFEAARSAAAACPPEGGDPDCAARRALERQAAEALVTAHVDHCAGRAWRAAAAVLGATAAEAVGGGDVPRIEPLVAEAATRAATVCIADLTDAPADPRLTGEAVGHAVTAQVLALPAVVAVRTASGEVSASCRPPEPRTRPAVRSASAGSPAF